ncbi:CDP-glycerol glycerophosphotransferase family protein [Kineosporia sp. A_224]|uniref:bifunctional glycosyltransferase/CDP-glycerol:glycerophosphate glycerophosphotransferase n=1 Tax=Kineosporia sp. A_224 TaxID=1962180 RepID=UPI000B4C0E5F|nr:CDP-glycerol glycerophosphotransferase family protein [Kineosporia sp. A_224]
MTRHSTYDICVVTAVHDVARYLPDFIASLEGQRGVPLDRIQVVAVDDGSNDDSLAVLERWAARSALGVTVLTKPNGGQASARNLGLEHAAGEWVTFTDPDDTLAPDWCARVLAFAGAHPGLELVATPYWILDDATGRVTNTHPTRRRFAGPDRVEDLDETGTFFGSANAGLFRRDRLVEQGLRFDERIRPNFEDGHFTALYLLGCPTRRVGFVGSAHYRYRRRSDGTSTLQQSLVQPARYTTVPRLGLLPTLEAGAAATGGRPPAWVQNIVLYELSWYFTFESQDGRPSAAVGEVGEEFVGLLRQIRTLLDDDVIARWDARELWPQWRQILRHGLLDEPWHSPNAVVEQADCEQGLVKVVTRFTGAEPQTSYLAGGAQLTPVHTKLRTHVYFGATLLRERISWLPQRAGLTVRVAGVEAEPARAWEGPPPRRPARSSGPRGALRRLGSVAGTLHAEPRRVLGAVRARVRGAVLTRLVRTAPVRARYADAWVLMDRLRNADDNAERLFEYLRENRPDVNAWFVLDPGSHDWARMRTAHGERVVAYGSRRWQLLMFSCRHLISSHVDVPIHRPRKIMWALGGREPQWRFTFLQHGVIKDDVSAWLNPKAMDLFVTSTQPEQDSIAGDRTPYVFTTREARLTGLPRFDRLRAIAASLTPADRDLVLVAPTWRSGLMGPFAPVTGDRKVRADFLDTEYAKAWLGVLRSPDLAALAREHGLRIGFLPHPQLQQVLPTLDLPPYVEPLTFAGGGAQRLFASAAALVTDYSSMAFNAAYVDRPVVYFQFDRDLVRAGGHLGRAGYFDYERDGFGPVTLTVDQTVAAVAEIAARGCTPSEEYLKRIEETFVLRDGRCCERVTTAIEALTRPAC